MLFAVAAVALVAAPRSWDWASASAEWELLKSFAPLAGDAPKAPFVRLGGACFRPGAGGTVKLGDGAEDGHVWHWTLELKVRGGEVTLKGPGVKHGFDRKGDSRTFTDPGPTRKLAVGPGVEGVWPLYEAAHQLELACFGTDESTGVCEGKKKTCKKCSTLRLVGGPRGGQHVYGDGVVRANLDESCQSMCAGPGLTWADFEALQALVGKTRVVDLETAPVAQLFATRELCEAAKADLDPSFAAVEPAVPARRR